MAKDEAYFEAEKRIEEAQHSGVTHLVLANFELTEVPKSIGQLINLNTLYLYNNKLTNLPAEIGDLFNLTELIAWGNQLSSLPSEIGRLTNLSRMSLFINELASIPQEIGQLTNLADLDLSYNSFTTLPKVIYQLPNLTAFNIGGNAITSLPEELWQLTQLTSIGISIGNLNKFPSELWQLPQLTSLAFYSGNINFIPIELWQFTQLKSLSFHSTLITNLPADIGQLNNLTELLFYSNDLISLPGEIGNLTKLKRLEFSNNRLSDLPPSLAQLDDLIDLGLKGNPLNMDLATAYEQGIDAVKAYLRAKDVGQVTLNEAKLILVGEGEVGKSCLMDALRGEPWQEHTTTHGIEIKPIQVADPDSAKEITLNGWDFGGQRVYRPTHQLFFSAPAVYLVVWKPREGPQQGFVKEWISLIKHREPDAKILVVATHGGPQQRQPDIDRQELWDLFGSEMVKDFFFVESKPDENGKRKGIEELKLAISRLAAGLPEMGRSVPKSFQDVRETLKNRNIPYLPLDEVLLICRDHNMDEELSRLFITISHRLGHLIHYQHDPILQNIVVLKPDWLTTAISFVLDDEDTRKAHGLVHFSRLGLLWNDQTRTEDCRYPETLHPIFIRLMERFYLSYRVADISPHDNPDPQCLIAQLVPDNRPENDLKKEWPIDLSYGDLQQVQICRILDENGNSANAEGLFYQLIVRLHKYSLGRIDYNNSVHWQRGLVLDNDYNGRAFLEHKGNDVYITVRASYPEGFLMMLTNEVKYLVESFWEGLHCKVMVPCIEPCGRNKPGTGMYEVQKLIESKRKNRPEYPCPVCNEWQNIDSLLRNATAAQPVLAEELLESHKMLVELRNLRRILITQYDTTLRRFDNLDAGQRELLSKADASFTGLIQALTDEAKEGPRLFSFMPVDRSKFNPKEWTTAKFRLTLWCEHSRLPLPALNGEDDKKGVYDLELTHDWLKKAGPYLKLLTGTLSLVLPVASSAIKLALNDSAYKAIEEQLDFGKNVIEATFKEGKELNEFMGKSDKSTLEQGDAIRAQGSTLRELHVMLKAKDPGFGGLVRVMNKRQEFLWVHPQFEKEY